MKRVSEALGVPDKLGGVLKRRAKATPYKALALEMGFKHVAFGIYQDAQGEYRDSVGWIIEEPKCWVCGDAGFVKVPPVISRHPGHMELAVCQCNEAAKEA